MASPGVYARFLRRPWPAFWAVPRESQALPAYSVAADNTGPDVYAAE